MSAKTGIEWTDQTWNPLAAFLKRDNRLRALPAGTRGWFCTKCSPGCAHCYAEKINIRLGNGLEYTLRHLDEIEFRLVNLDDPVHWRKPRMVFVNSMTDLFHEAVPDRLIDQVFAVMALADRHTFQVLTKRAARMRDYVANQIGLKARMAWQMGKIVLPHDRKLDLAEWERGRKIVERIDSGESWPLPNVWLGVSVENQNYADERIPLLLQTPAAVRFLSCEPLLGPVDFSRVYAPHGAFVVPNGINWVIIGGESGPKARPMHPDWARSLRDQCVAAGVRFFFKQWGEWLPISALSEDQFWNVPPAGIDYFEGVAYSKLGKKRAGRLLDGREWNEFPASASVRQKTPRQSEAATGEGAER